MALAVSDYESAHHAQGPTGGCVESNRLFTSQRPSRATFYSRGLPLDFAIETLGYVVWRKHRHHNHDLWALPFIAVSYSHATGIYSNLTCH